MRFGISFGVKDKNEEDSSRSFGMTNGCHLEGAGDLIKEGDLFSLFPPNSLRFDLRFPTKILRRKAGIFVDFFLDQFIHIRGRRAQVDVVAARF